MLFYKKLLPALGFIRTFHSEKWKVLADEGGLLGQFILPSQEDTHHKPNSNLIGLWEENRKEVNRIVSGICF